MALEAVLVLVFVLLPGVVADAAYRFITWRPDPTDQATFVRATVISFGSLFGLLMLERVLRGSFGVPVYLQPQWWTQVAGLPALPWTEVARGWLEHAGVALAGAVGVGLIVRLRGLTGILQRLVGRPSTARRGTSSRSSTSAGGS